MIFNGGCVITSTSWSCKFNRDDLIKMRPNKNAQPIILDKLGILLERMYDYDQVCGKIFVRHCQPQMFFNNVDNLFDQAN